MKYIRYTILFVTFFVLSPIVASSFTIIKNINTQNTNSFSITPATIEFELSDINTEKKEIKISNSSGQLSEFTIEFQESSSNQQQKLNVLSVDKYISADKNKFILDHGEDALVTLTAKTPGGNNSKFVDGVVLVTRKALNGVEGGSQVLTKLGALFFIDIGKLAIRSGYLDLFSYNDGGFLISFKNTGEAKLNPYGFIETRSMTGAVIERIQVDPFFVIPGSERQIKVNTNKISRFSPFYTARLVLYPGYGEAKNTETKLITVYNFYTMFIYLVFLLFLIATFIFFKKYVKK